MFKWVIELLAPNCFANTFLLLFKCLNFKWVIELLAPICFAKAFKLQKKQIYSLLPLKHLCLNIESKGLKFVFAKVKEERASCSARHLVSCLWFKTRFSHFSLTRVPLIHSTCLANSVLKTGKRTFSVTFFPTKSQSSEMR